MSPSTVGVGTTPPKVTRKRKVFAASQRQDCLSDGDLSENDSPSPKSQSPQMEDDRRAHHNELERRRRDHIKDHFVALKDAIPLLEGEKSSRALILKRAVEYITMMKKKIVEDQDDIEKLKLRNEQLEAQVKLLEQPRIRPVVGEEVGSMCCTSKLSQYNIGGCAPGPSSIPKSLLPQLNASAISIPTATVAASFPLPSDLNPEPKLTAFTPVTQSSLFAPPDPFTDSLFPSLPNQLVSSMILGSTSFKPLSQSLRGPEFDYNIHSRIIANSQLATAVAHH